jgi:flagellar hook-associated protein 3 FlgL
MTTSFSRLGTANTYDNALRNLTGRQTSLSNLQENLTSGKKVVRASDDPTGAAQAERAQTRLARIIADQRALESQRNSIAMAESTLGDVSDAINNFRELVVSAGNGSHTAEERKTIAVQLQGLRDQVLALSNRQDTNGLPLFGALGSKDIPFGGVSPNYAFNGLPGQKTSSEFAIPFALDGQSAFMLPAGSSAQKEVFNVTATTSNVTAPTSPGNPELKLGSNVVVTDKALLNGSAYEVNFTSVVEGADGMVTATYTVKEVPDLGTVLTANGTVLNPSTPTPPPVVFKKGTPINITLTGVPGMGAIKAGGEPDTVPGSNPEVRISARITGTPKSGDVMALKATPRTSVFSVLDDAISGLHDAPNSSAANQSISQSLISIDFSLNRLSAVRGQAGDLLNRADRITANQEKRSIQLEGDRSRAEDLDMIKGVADFQNQQTGYQAALQSYAQVQKLSLFNFIS